MSTCRKCELPIRWIQREFQQVLKWVPVNLDGTEHWDNCKRETRKRLAGESFESVMAYAETQCPTFWTVPKQGGGYRVMVTKPVGWGESQPAPDAELF